MTTLNMDFRCNLVSVVFYSIGVQEMNYPQASKCD